MNLKSKLVPSLLTMPSFRFVGGDTFHKELQGFVSFVACQKTCLCNGTAMSQLAYQEALANEHFCNPDDDDSVGRCEQNIEGVGLFAHSFDREERIQTDAQSKNTNSRNLNQALALVTPSFNVVDKGRCQ
jgi:hypothetical protein